MRKKLLYTTTALVIFSAPVAHADPISLAVAALSTASTAVLLLETQRMKYPGRYDNNNYQINHCMMLAVWLQ